MRDTDFSFDSTGVEPAAPMEVLPDAWYRAMASSVEMKKTKADDGGKYLEFTWKVLDGPYKNRIVWDRLNVINANETAQEIAERALSAICHATKVLKFRNPTELLHIPILIKVTIKTEKNRSPSNEVKGYKPDESNGNTGPAVAAVARKHGFASAPTQDDNDDLPF